MPLAIILKHKREINAQPMVSYTYNKLLTLGLSYNAQSYMNLRVASEVLKKMRVSKA